VEVSTKNFFAPLRTAEMEIEQTNVEDSSNEPQQSAAKQVGRPPPIVLTTTTNMLALQKHIREIATGNFEFRNTRSGTKIVTKEMTDFSAIRKYLEQSNLSYFTFFPKSEKPIKAVLRHLPANTPAQNISEGLVYLGFDITSVKQMSTNRRSTSEKSVPQQLHLFLITLPRTEKSKEIFKLATLCHVVIRVEAYRAQSGLTQCHNCQQFGHVWANYKQSPRCLWCGGGRLHKECPEKKNAASTPACCNCQLAEGAKPTPPTIGAAATRGKSCKGEKPRGHPKLQRGGCSPPAAPRQLSPSRLRSEEVQHSNNSNPRRANLSWLILTTLRLLGGIKMQVSQSGPQV
jgi:hypothetical protein